MSGWENIETSKTYNGETYELHKMTYPNKATAKNLAAMRRKQGYKVRIVKVPASKFGNIRYIYYERKI